MTPRINYGLPDLPGMPDLDKLTAPHVRQLQLGNVLDATLDLDAVPKGQRAVVYFRVSDPSQTKTSRDYANGASMETQRQLCYERATALGYTVIEEYVEPGKSAMSIEKRPVFRQMLARIQARRDVNVVLVYMFERAARNQWEDAVLGIVFQSLGVQLISVTEPMDDTPAGKAMRGMISVFNEMMSTSRGADIKRKMEAAAKRGQTLGRARLGYLNVRDISEGRDIRTIEIDTERAPFVKLAFELYATGEYTLNDIVDELTDRGLTTRATAKRPAGPVSVNKVHQMLRDPYYTGVVTYDGEQIPGKHHPLISQELFDKAQEVSRIRGKSGERRREHHHYLKGTVFCGQCKQERDIDRRLLVQRTVGKNGQEYFYYFCPGTKDGTCTSPHHNLYRVEDAVERHYKTKRYTPEFLRAFRALMADTLGSQDEAQRLLKKQLDGQLDALDVQEENLLDLAADGTVAPGKIKVRLRKIGQERERLTTQRDAVAVDLTSGAKFLDSQLSLLENPHELYKNTTDEVRRRLNQAVFGAIYITDEDVVGSRLTSPHDALFATEAAYQAATLGLNEDAIRQHFAAAFARSQGQTIPAKHKETAPKGGLFADNSTVATTAWSSLFTGSAAGAVSSKPPMVELGGIEPPSNAESPRLLRAQSVQTFCSAPTFVTDT